jgi:hypothetical protein
MNLSGTKIEKTYKCPHKWEKNIDKKGFTCQVCTASGFLDHSVNIIYMRKNATNFQKAKLPKKIFYDNFKNDREK